jgi:hypothetical protein
VGGALIGEVEVGAAIFLVEVSKLKVMGYDRKII